MKSTMKMFGIVALTAIIGIAMTACPSDGSGDSTVAVTGVDIDQSKLLFFTNHGWTDEKNKSRILRTTVSPANATNQTVRWASSDSTVATVANGVVTAVAEGAATITVTTEDGGKMAYCNVTVQKSLVDMVQIQAGTFIMGSPQNEPGRGSDEALHEVTLTKRFYMGVYEVTQAQYKAVTGDDPSYFNGTVGYEPANGEVQGRRPVERVTWYDAIEFCNKLSVKEGLEPVYTITGRVPGIGYPITSATVTADFSKNGYRLPTEAEWEYACRAGTTTAYSTGDEISDETGWYSANSGSKTHEVGKKPANAWGLHDMHGNVLEWCNDWYGTYSSGSQTNPTGVSSGSSRVRRGGGWGNSAQRVRSAYQGGDTPANRNDGLGFRLVRPAL